MSTFVAVKMRLWHIIVLMWLTVFAASCGNRSGGDTFKVSPELSTIDSLMWKNPDSALTVMIEFAASPEADSLNAFEGHYCQVLIAELLFKNDYAQSNRTELLKAVGYFDSIVDLRGADARGVSVPFLDAWAHYINGAGYYEHDSLTEACAEYLNTLRIMESHFGENEMVGKKARFMALTYSTESYKSY